MTEKRLEKLMRYGRKVYYRDFRYRDEPIEDFLQTFILFALENPEDTPALILWKIRNQSIHKNPYRLRYFSEIESDERYKNGLGYLENLLRIEESGYELGRTDSVDDLAEILYERDDLRELFLDYMHGQPCGDYFQRKCRDKLFRWRFKILDELERSGKIVEREKAYFEAIARGMTKPAPVKKNVLDTSKARAQRAYYERNRAKESERKKLYRARKKQEQQARQAERANSAKEI